MHPIALVEGSSEFGKPKAEIKKRPPKEPRKHPMLDDDCAICSQWPRALRETMRRAIDELPLSKQVCDKCLRAFWVTLWARHLGAGLKRTR
jgi:hypothetical protein